MLTPKTLPQIKAAISKIDDSIIEDWYRNEKGTNGIVGIGEYGDLYFIDYEDEVSYLVERSIQTESGLAWEPITHLISNPS